ncbi:MAG: ribulokinase [Prevotellaceae bacterium]|jgi:L-ribulokinase|nr:ribulokinase [Prevotellaceae bacterium]
MKYVIGLDYGTDSCRAIVVDALTGEEMATAVHYYARWKDGKYCDPKSNRYRQHPLDYVEAMEQTIRESLKKCAPEVAKSVVGISFDTTGSTPALTDKNGTPLALLPEFAENPNAMFVLWKDHTAVAEALEITAAAKKWAVDYTLYEGGVYSSEWVWAKALHILREDASVRRAACSWVEHCDWISALLTGSTQPEAMARSRCAAGHKAMWSEKWGGLPSENFLLAVDPLLAKYRERLYTETYPSGHKAGTITKEWADKLGLPENVAVGVGAFDCHMGAVGAAIEPYTFVRVIGTSTCDIMVVKPEEMGSEPISGICGQVDGSVIPGMVGLEAGQSSFGDVYAWFKRILSFPVENILAKTKLVDEETRRQLVAEAADEIIPALTKEAEKIPIEESAIVATDWLNGRRTPYANQQLTGSITGLSLGSAAPLIFRALVEATAFGSKAIVDHFVDAGIRIDSVTGIGGISLKSPFVMQTLADVLNMPIRVCKTEQACALGAAMFAAVAAGVYAKVEDAQQAMAQGFASSYTPDGKRHEAYARLYAKYRTLGEFSEKSLGNFEF